MILVFDNERMWKIMELGRGTHNAIEERESKSRKEARKKKGKN